MGKKAFVLCTAVMMTAAASGIIYADASGSFYRNDDAAAQLIDKYMESVMRSYRGEKNVSFRGIIKEGCDFWYYNDYNNDLICEMSRSEGEPVYASYTADIDSIEYYDHTYTIEAHITQSVKYPTCSEAVSSDCMHTFVVKQDGRAMYIVNEISDGTDKLLTPVKPDKTETRDIP